MEETLGDTPFRADLFGLVEDEGGVRAGMCTGTRLSRSWAQPGTQGTTWHCTGFPWHRPAACQLASANPVLLPSPRQRRGKTGSWGPTSSG